MFVVFASAGQRVASKAAWSLALKALLLEMMTISADDALATILVPFVLAGATYRPNESASGRERRKERRNSSSDIQD